MSKLPFGNAVTADLRFPGDRFGPYSILSVISVSLFGALYRVRSDEGGDFCLHVIPSALNKDGHLQKQLPVSLARLEKAESPSLLKVLGVQVVDGLLVVLHEAVDGLALNECLFGRDGGSTVSPEEARYFLNEILSALRAADAVGAHHFHLTPEWVLITSEGKLKVGGFGVFEAIERKRFEHFLSTSVIPIQNESGLILFTALDVLAPEIRNEETADVRADLYALGLIAYFLLTGKKPVADWVLPSKSRPGLSEGWDLLISHCFESDPKNRYASVTQFQADLAEVDKLHLRALEAAKAAEGAQSGGAVLRKLDKVPIPLPKSVQSKMNTDIKRVLRLVLIGLTGIATVGVASYFYQSAMAPTDSPADSIRRTAPNATPRLRLILNADRAIVKFLLQDASYTTDRGRLGVDLPEGRYLVKIEAAGFRPQQMEVTIGAQPVEKTIELLPAWGELVLKAPAGSRIFAQGENQRRSFLETVPESGELSLRNRLFARSYTLEVEKEGYLPKSVEVVLKERQVVTQEVVLTPRPTELLIQSEPAGAEVFIGSEKVGVTPFEYRGLEPGQEHLVKVQALGMRARSLPVVLELGQRKVLDFGPLEAQVGRLSLELRLNGIAPEGAALTGLKVLIDGKALEAGASLEAGLRAGSRKVLVSHPDYFDAEAEVRIQDATTTRQELNLEPRPARVRLVLPEGKAATLKANGMVVVPNEEGRYVVPAGSPVDLELAVRDHYTLRQQLTFRANEAAEFTPGLKAIEPPEPNANWQIPYVGSELIWLKSGSVNLGSPLEEQMRLPSEEPRTLVRFSRGFWMARTEVVQGLYQRLMGDNPSAAKAAKRPVENVTWDEAVRFCEKLTQQERGAGRLPPGYVYRLPTEAEWEYACRAGTTTPFNFGVNADVTKGQFIGTYPREYSSATITSNREGAGTREVGGFPANEWGLVDMHGNVREWVLDYYNERLPGGSVTDWWRREESSFRGYRGGGWEDSAHRCRSAARDRLRPDTRDRGLGFRFVLAPEL